MPSKITNANILNTNGNLALIEGLQGEDQGQGQNEQNAARPADNAIGQSTVAIIHSGSTDTHISESSPGTMYIIYNQTRLYLIDSSIEFSNAIEPCDTPQPVAFDDIPFGIQAT